MYITYDPSRLCWVVGVQVWSVLGPGLGYGGMLGRGVLGPSSAGPGLVCARSRSGLSWVIGGGGPGSWRSRSAGLGGSQRLLAPRTDVVLDHVPQPSAEVEVGSYHDVTLRRWKKRFS